MIRSLLTMAALLCALPASAEITAARYADPTDRYPHGVLGDALEWGTLELVLADGTVRRFEQPAALVFEDLAPRLADLNGDGAPEVIVVEAHRNFGARLSVYGPNGLIAATPPIGQRFRWLAPFAWGDLDGDGEAAEIAYVDRPHLAKTLRVVRLEGGTLTEIAATGGLTNHRIGEDFISGGLRDCGEGPEMLLASANWLAVMSVRLRSGVLITRQLGPFEGPGSFAAAEACAM